MEKSVLRPLNRCCCCRYRGSRESEPLFLAVYKNNLEELRSLLEAGMSPNAKSERGNTLLNYVIEHKRIEIFDFLLSLDDTDVDSLDSSGRSPLLYAAAESSDDYFAMTLIEKGADIHLGDDAGFTFLHLAARRKGDNSRVGRLIIERGVDVNCLNNFGETPLFIACEQGNANWIHLLLYHGAVATITCNNGVLPIAVLPRGIDLGDVLMDHTFDEIGNTVRLPTMVAAMACDSSLFSKIVAVTSEVTYDVGDLKHLDSNLIYLRAENFKLFTKKFGNIVREMIEYFPPLPMLVRIGLNLEIAELKGILYAFVESDCISEFVRTSDPTYPIISHLVEIFNGPTMFTEEEEVTKIVCLLLSYGLGVTSDDLDTVYDYYGNCRLFKILLHMDIDLAYVGKTEFAMAALYYDFCTEPGDLLKNLRASSDILSYSNHPKLKETYINAVNNQDVKIKAQSLPSVPCLVELCRNVVRSYIVAKYKIKNSRQFYTVLKWLPIGEIFKKIITLDRKLYWF